MISQFFEVENTVTFVFVFMDQSGHTQLGSHFFDGQTIDELDMGAAIPQACPCVISNVSMILWDTLGS